MKLLLIAALSLVLAGCKSMLPSTVNVPTAVPIKCKAKEPVRPVMPTEQLPPDLPDDVFLDRFAKAAAAEIERREAYEGELVVALRSCI